MTSFSVVQVVPSSKATTETAWPRDSRNLFEGGACRGGSTTTAVRSGGVPLLLPLLLLPDGGAGSVSHGWLPETRTSRFVHFRFFFNCERLRVFFFFISTATKEQEGPTPV